MEKNKVPIYWIAAAVYYTPVILGAYMGWLGEGGTLILLFVPIPIVYLYHWLQFRKLSRYLEENHPEEWGGIAGRWVRSVIGERLRAEMFAFSRKLDEDPSLRAMKRNFKHLSLLTYFMVAGIIVFMLFIPAGR